MVDKTSPITVLIADDQTLLRNSLETMLALETDIKVVGSAENGKIAYEMAEKLRPNVLLLDIKMPVMDGIETLKRLKETMPQIKVIILTMFDEEQHIIDALANGADGFLLKEMSGDELINAIKKVVKGQILLPTSVAAKIASRLAHMSVDQEAHEPYQPRFEVNDYTFSKREQEIISLMYQGYTNKQISEKLFISEGTVKNYISNIYNKIGVHNRAKALAQLRKYMSSANF